MVVGMLFMFMHADGSIAWYGHMKSGSLTEKQDTVAQGEYLGIIGSSILYWSSFTF